jgi:hypothetical protein
VPGRAGEPTELVTGPASIRKPSTAAPQAGRGGDEQRVERDPTAVEVRSGGVGRPIILPG